MNTTNITLGSQAYYELLCALFNHRRTHRIGVRFLSLVGVTLSLHFQPASFGQGESDTPWARALSRATEYVASARVNREEAIDLYQRVLDLQPPRNVGLHVRLTMLARMTILFDPDLGEEPKWAEALPLYEALVAEYQDWPNHHDLMVAKIFLGDLYCELQGQQGLAKATPLYWSVIEVSGDEVVFDDPTFEYLNSESIARSSSPLGRRVDPHMLPEQRIQEMNAKHRQRLLETRTSYTDAVRRSAIWALANKILDPVSPSISIARLDALKQQRRSDTLFQETVDGMIRAQEKTVDVLQGELELELPLLRDIMKDSGGEIQAAP